MDNIAHSMVGTLVGASILPDRFLKHRSRVAITSAVVANLPDVDILLSLLGKEVYFFHHRGLTHSFLGLVLTVPLGLCLTRRLLRPTGQLSWPTSVFFVLIQLLFSHFFLDYLTTFGTMFLYPFSMARFSYPLLFIVDPMLWLIVGLGCFAAWRVRDRNPSRIRRVVFSAAACLALWAGIHAWVKVSAENQFTEEAALVEGSARSFPLPMAPLLWLLLGKQESDHSYVQGVYSLAADRHLHIYPVPPEFHQDKPPESVEVEPGIFESFVRWAEHVVCREDEFGLVRSSCVCQSLKYNIVQSGIVTFGAMRFTDSKEHYLIAAVPGQFLKLIDYYQNLLFFGHPNLDRKESSGSEAPSL